MSPLVLRSTLRFLLRHPWQGGLAVLGIALGVAVVVAIDLANASAGRAFELSTEALAGRATHQVVGGPGGLPDGLFTRLVVGAGVHPAAPVVEGFASAGAGAERRTLRVLGVDPFSEGPFRPELAAEAPAGPAPGGAARPALGPLVTRPGAALLAAGTAHALGLAPGDRFAVEVAGHRRPLLVAGLLEPAGARSRQALSDLLVMDVSSAQELLGEVGRLDRIELMLPGAEGSPRAARALARLRAVLPPGARIEAAGARLRTFREMTRAFRLNLAALSLLALVCGVFLIYNTMTFSVVQRRPLIGTLRALGVTRRELFASLLVEALLVGAVGTAIGVVAGAALGEVLLRLVTRTINDLYFVLSVRHLALAPASLAKGVVLGLGATVAAALAPAIEAASAPPRAVMIRSLAEARARRAVPRAALAGLLLLAGGGVFLWLPSDRLAPAFAGLAGVVVGCALLTPAATVGLMAALGRPAGALFGVLGRMAARGVVAALSRTGVAVVALVIAVSVTVGVGVMIGSFRATVVGWLDQTLRADLYVSPPGPGPTLPGAGLDPAVVRAIRTAPGVDRVDVLRRSTARLEEPRPKAAQPTLPVELMAFDLGPRGRRSFRLLAGDPERAWAAVERGAAVLVSEPLATRRHLAPGDRIRLGTEAGPRAFEIAGVYADFGRGSGAVLLDLSTYRRLWRDRGISALSIYAAPGVDREVLAERLRRLAAPHQEVLVRPNRFLREKLDGDLRPHLRHHLGAPAPGRPGRLRRGALGAHGAPARARPGARRAARQRHDAGAGVAARHLADRAHGPRRGAPRRAGRPGAGGDHDLRHQPALVRLDPGDASGAGDPPPGGRPRRRRRAGGGPLPRLADGPHSSRQRAEGRVMGRSHRLRALAGLVCLAGTVACSPSPGGRPAPPRAALSVADAMRGSPEAGFARALAPRPFRFPADHGPHPGFRTEWWYFTGNLTAADGRHFGYQLTVFRDALAPPDAEPAESGRPSAWATRQAYLAHFALTDVAGGRFHSAARLARGALGLAGARAAPFHAWVEDWGVQAAGDGSGGPGRGPGALGPLALRAADGGSAVDLHLEALRPPVLHGDQGLSEKGGGPGNASFYYSITRLATRGTVRAGGRQIPVTGLSWFDREWSTSALAADEVGWDWFSLQLSDGWDLMLYRLRRRDGSLDPASSGTLVGPQGETRHLDAGDLALRVERRWRSPRSGALYPAGWRLEVPAAGLALRVRPLLADQELDVGFRYWEGAVELAGTHAGRPVSGRGYVELTGYRH